MPASPERVVPGRLPSQDPDESLAVIFNCLDDFMTDKPIKKNVREFYDQVGWQRIDADRFQNAQYEDLRLVSREYIHRCHMRVKRHLAPEGRYLLDAGSGPVQYQEYLTYSEGYQARVCMDISIVALRAAREKLGEKGMFVVGDVAHLPFKSDAFDGIVSLHTIHHVPMEDKLLAYDELYRTLNPGQQMVVVDGWTNAPLMTRLSGFMHFMKRAHRWWRENIKKETLKMPAEIVKADGNEDQPAPRGTYVQKLSAEWLTQALKGRMDHEILVWRSVSVPFLRAVFYEDWGGRFWLKALFLVEELFPHFLGKVGQYPLVVVRKPTAGGQGNDPQQ
jgi:ubiquinone/menaquinone biosynthesis C-methylase UbiE